MLRAKAEIDRLTAAFFALFSNRRGTPDLAGIYDLFVEQGVIAKCTAAEAEISTLQEFIWPRQELLSNGSLTDFFEAETAETTEILGHIARRTSEYRKSGILNGAPFETRGVKMFQFIETERGWRILSVTWDDERDGFALPE